MTGACLTEAAVLALPVGAVLATGAASLVDGFGYSSRCPDHGGLLCKVDVSTVP